MNSRRASVPLRAIVASVVVFAFAVGAIVLVLNRSGDSGRVTPRCTTTADGTTWALSPEQADNAALIAGTSLRRSLPARAATIGLATAMQESKLINVRYGDRDSLGLFQQRPSQGWGTAEQVQDAVYATNAFYDALVRLDGYETLPVTEAAQKVQHSGYPTAYARHEASARAWASALTGYSAQTLACTLKQAPAASPTVYTQRVARDLGGLETAVAGHVVTVDASSLAPDDPARAGWAVAQWSVASAQATGVVEVDVLGQRWMRDDGAWHAAAGDRVPAGEVRVTIAG